MAEERLSYSALLVQSEAMSGLGIFMIQLPRVLPRAHAQARAQVSLPTLPTSVVSA
jgi:hypothetical protein